MRKQATKPKQAASKSTLDKWQRDVQVILHETVVLDGLYLRLIARIRRLLASMEQTELR